MIFNRKIPEFATTEEAIPFVKKQLRKNSNARFRHGFYFILLGAAIIYSIVSGLLAPEEGVQQMIGEQIAYVHYIAGMLSFIIGGLCIFSGVRWRAKSVRKVLEKGKKKK